MAKPKVFSLFHEKKYSDRFPDVPVMGVETDLFVECECWELNIPVPDFQERELNIFQESVLRLMQLRPCEADRLAEILCMPKEFVRMVLTQLNDLGYLKNNVSVTAEGEAALARDRARSEAVRYIQGRVFRPLGSDFWMPYVQTGDIQTTFEEVERYSQEELTIAVGTAGRRRQRRGDCIRGRQKPEPGRGKRTPPALIPQELLRTILLRFNRIMENQGREAIPLRSDYAIECSHGQNVYFHVKGVVPEGNVDQRLLSDGFVRSVDRLREHIRATAPESFRKIGDKALTAREEQEERREAVWDTRYPEVSEWWMTLARQVQSDRDSGNRDERRETRFDGQRRIHKCYSLLEWAFCSYLRRNPLPKEKEQFLCANGSMENERFLLEMAEGLGLRGTSESHMLFDRVDQVRIDTFRRKGEPTLQLMFPLSMLEAAGNQQSTLHDLFREQPDLLHFLAVLYGARGNSSHQAASELRDRSIPDPWPRTRQIVRLILPDLRIETAAGGTSGGPGDVSNRRLQAQLDLEDKIGSTLYYMLDAPVKEELLKLFGRDKGKGLSGISCSDYILSLSKIMERVLLLYVKGLRPQKGERKQEAIRTIDERYRTEVPQNLQSVKARMYTKAAENRDGSTLGAYLLRALSGGPELRVRPWIEEGILPFVSRLIELRGHGNRVDLTLSLDELEELKEKTLKLIRKLGE